MKDDDIMRALRTTSAISLVAVAGLALTGCSMLGSEDSVFNLEVGDCLNVSSLSEEITEVPTVDCAEEHEAEIYTSADLPDGDFPTAEAMDEEIMDVCIGEFDAFVGMPYEDSQLDYNVIYPSAESWADGDRELICYVYEMDGSMVTGTLKGAAR